MQNQPSFLEVRKSFSRPVRLRITYEPLTTDRLDRYLSYGGVASRGRIFSNQGKVIL